MGFLYDGQEKIGVSWEQFRKEYMSKGGDGIYGAWSVPYLEPLMSQRSYVSRLPHVYKDTFYKPGLCPVAEKIQSKMMVFKTNYRDMKLADVKAAALSKTIEKFTK